jgi:hypothetical protein
MRAKALFAALLFTVPFLAGTSQVRGDHYYHARQYYSPWHYYSANNYYYRYYYYKPYDSYVGYKHHYVFYYPETKYSNYYYYYNPYSKQYWGRCPTYDSYDGTAHYSLLPVSARKGDLEQIDESSFPPMGAMPPIPESKEGDGATVDLPPDDGPAKVPGNLPKTRPAVTR